jgi:hypothetical protein
MKMGKARFVHVLLASAITGVASCGPRGPVADEPLKPGTYAGADRDGDTVTVNVVADGSKVLVQSVGEDFQGSGIQIESITSKGGSSFGSYKDNILTFPIVFMIKFVSASSVLAERGGQSNIAAYDCTLWRENKKTHLVLVRHNGTTTFEPSFNDMRFSEAKDDFAMKARYEFVMQ